LPFSLLFKKSLREIYTTMLFDSCLYCRYTIFLLSWDWTNNSSPEFVQVYPLYSGPNSNHLGKWKYNGGNNKVHADDIIYLSARRLILPLINKQARRALPVIIETMLEKRDILYQTVLYINIAMWIYFHYLSVCFPKKNNKTIMTNISSVVFCSKNHDSNVAGLITNSQKKSGNQILFSIWWFENKYIKWNCEKDIVYCQR
jgi:hypothetical protein